MNLITIPPGLETESFVLEADALAPCAGNPAQTLGCRSGCVDRRGRKHLGRRRREAQRHFRGSRNRALRAVSVPRQADPARDGRTCRRTAGRIPGKLRAGRGRRRDGQRSGQTRLGGEGGPLLLRADRSVRGRLHLVRRGAERRRTQKNAALSGAAGDRR